MKACIDCGADITASHGRKKRCNFCQSKFDRKTSAMRSKLRRKASICATCDAPVVEGDFCSDKCEKEFFEQIYGDKKLRSCPCCLQHFQPVAHVQIFCSTGCQEQVKRIKAFLNKKEIKNEKGYRLYGLDDMSDKMADFLYQEFWVQGEQGLREVILAGRKYLFGESLASNSNLADKL